jgi:hypothetical protein
LADQSFSLGDAVLPPGGGCGAWPVYLKYGFLRSSVLDERVDEPSTPTSIVTS